MHDADLLSSDERSTIELCMRRMSGTAFGSLATLPLYCLHELEIPDIHSFIDERYEIWRSFLVVIREILESKSSLPIATAQPLNALFSATVALRDSYRQISKYDEFPSTQVIAAHVSLVSAFDRIEPALKNLAAELRLDADSSLKTLKARRRSYDNTLKWLGEELRKRSAGVLVS